MSEVYDLAKIGPQAFENIVNFLALKTLGLGLTGFSPGADGGRDGYFEGEAPYPSGTQRWKGIWYIQSKFHSPHLSRDPQKWIVGQVAEEINAFEKDESTRKWPNNWIIATNIDQSGKPETGSFDAIRALLKKSTHGKSVNVDVWGGRKILDLLSEYPDVSRYYGHFLTPGHVLSALYDELGERKASIEEIARYFVASQFTDHTFTKLDQAGSSSDVRPAVHDLFVDLPFSVPALQIRGSGVLAELSCAAAQCHRHSLRKQYPENWRAWSKHSKRARVMLIKGGPGQGKSTVGQYLSQINRAALILSPDGPPVLDGTSATAAAVRDAAIQADFWPTVPRIPIQVELKEFAHWHSQRNASQSRSVLAYVSETVAKKLGIEVLSKTIKSALSRRSWIVIFDGLDEVPNDAKDAVANEVIYFLNETLVEIDADVLSICTSRPQGYSGQFAELDGPVVDLLHLDPVKAMECAKPVLAYGRPSDEALQSIETLDVAMRSPNIRELMTTPLQSHIMAVVVRDGGRPPERRWQLFNSFYLVMKKRESLKNFRNARIAELLREEDRLLKAVHTRLGFVLHARAERSEGAQTNLTKEEFRQLVKDVVTQLDDHDIDSTVACVMEATTERLVLVSTPESGEYVRFDIRQLQEFFAAEFIYASVDPLELSARIEVIGGDAHWREVVHFLLSALVENQRTSDLSVAVQVLRGVNEGIDGTASTLYHRRMSRAGLLAARLLAEGVLEQDQRDRQQVKPLFETLPGLIDLESISALSRLIPDRSRQWFTQFLLDRITISHLRETAGAMFLLGWLLPDESNHSQSLILAFMNSPTPIQEQIIELWCPDEIPFPTNETSQRRRRSKWVSMVAVRILNSDTCGSYTPSAITRMIRICVENRENFVAICKEADISDHAAAAVLGTITLRDGNFPHSDLDRTEVVCGQLRATMFAENWVNRTMPAPLASIVARECIHSVRGIFRLLLCALWAAQDRSGESVIQFLNVADLCGVAKLSAIPARLRALVPLGSEYSIPPFSVEHLRRVSIDNSEKIAECARRCRVALPYNQLRAMGHSEKENSGQWRELSLTLPLIALEAVFHPREMEWAGQAQYGPELLDLLRAQPTITARYILQWGYLVKRQPQALEVLKESLRAISPEEIEAMRYSPIYPRIEPLQLNLPTDVYLLPFLAVAVLGAVLRYDDEQFHFVGKPPSPRRILRAFGMGERDLRAVAEDEKCAITARAGALALYWCSVWGVSDVKSRRQRILDLDLNVERKLYAEVVERSNQDWLTRALIQCVLLEFRETDPVAVQFAVFLLERCLDGDGARAEVKELMRKWRERSTAPVSSKQLLERWLGYSFQPPSYTKH